MSLVATRCDASCTLKEVNDFDENANTRKFLACKAASGNAFVDAVSTPILTESSLPRSWTLTGGEGAGKLSRSLSLNSIGPISVVAKCGNTKTATVDVRPNFKIEFSDAASRYKSLAPVTWDATLNVVSVSGPHSSSFTILDSMTWGYSISNDGLVSIHKNNAGSAIRVISFEIYEGSNQVGAYGGAALVAEYTGCAEETLQWNQVVTTNRAINGCTSPYNDPCPSSTPYYWTEEELPFKLTPVP